VITGGYLDVAGAIYASSPTYQGLPPNATVAGELRMPSYARSGLKVKLPTGFTVGSDTVLVVDFDVAQSFGHVAGGSGAWVMHPVIKASEAKDTGAIQVTLTLGPETILPDGVTLAKFQALLTKAGSSIGPVPLADLGAGSVGVTFPYLLQGDYDVSFVGPEAVAFHTDPPVPFGVTVVADQTTSAPFVLTDAEVPAP